MTVPAAGESARLASEIAPSSVNRGVERPITADQTNVSVVVDEAVIVKWFVPPVPEPHHGIDVLTHLRDVGFPEMPAYRGASARDGLVTATVSEFLPGAVDGWDWFVDHLTDWADAGGGATAELDEHAHAIGALAGRLHVALATPSRVIPRPVGEYDSSALCRRAESLLAEVLALGADGADGAAVVAEREEGIRRIIADTPRRRVPAITLHGDLHLGQIVRSLDRLHVIDFDGNPLADDRERATMRPLAIDVVSLVQSIDHAVRVAQRRRPEAAIDALAARLVEVTAAGHRGELDRVGLGGLLEDELRPMLTISQELHELVYAARHLPRWAYAPIATLRAMMPADGESGGR